MGMESKHQLGPTPTLLNGNPTFSSPLLPLPSHLVQNRSSFSSEVHLRYIHLGYNTCQPIGLPNYRASPANGPLLPDHFQVPLAHRTNAPGGPVYRIPPPIQPTNVVRGTLPFGTTPLVRLPPVGQLVGHPHLLAPISPYAIHSWQLRNEILSNVIKKQEDWLKCNVPPMLPAPQCLPAPRFPALDPPLYQEQVLVANFIMPPSPLHQHLAQEWLSKSEADIQTLVEDELAINFSFRLGWSTAKQKNVNLEVILHFFTCCLMFLTVEYVLTEFSNSGSLLYSQRAPNLSSF